MRDFIATRDGLTFAVVDAAPEDGKILCILRYVHHPDAARHEKLDTARANEFLQQRYPHFLHHSARLDAPLHAVPRADVVRHYRPRERLQQLLQCGPADAVEARLCRLMQYFAKSGLPLGQMGITGSLLIGAHTPRSDFDLVAYGRPVFLAGRQAVESGIAQGVLADLRLSDWRDTYRRRGCALSFDEFVWHERRKFNKALFEGTKFDLAAVTPDRAEPTSGWRKLGPLRLEAVVLDDSAAFDAPARYRINHPDVPEIDVHTQTYVGQARRGETVEAAGHLEQNLLNRRRLVIGSSREAPGEFLRVLRGRHREQADAR